MQSLNFESPTPSNCDRAFFEGLGIRPELFETTSSSLDLAYSQLVYGTQCCIEPSAARTQLSRTITLPLENCCASDSRCFWTWQDCSVTSTSGPSPHPHTRRCSRQCHGLDRAGSHGVCRILAQAPHHNSELLNNFILRYSHHCSHYTSHKD